MHALHARTSFVLLSVHSVCNDAQSRLADIIYGSQTELQKQVVMSEGASLDAMSLKDVQFSFLFLFFCIMLILSF